MPFSRGIGLPELIIVLVILLLLFGVGRLPQVGSALGKGVRQFRRSVSGEEEHEDPPSTGDKGKDGSPS